MYSVKVGIGINMLIKEVMVVTLLWIGQTQCGYIGQSNSMESSGSVLAEEIEALKTLVLQQNSRIESLTKKQEDSNARIDELENQLKSSVKDNLDLRQKLNESLECLDDKIKVTHEDLASLENSKQTTERSDKHRLVNFRKAFLSCKKGDVYLKTPDKRTSDGNGSADNVTLALTNIRPSKRFVFNGEEGVAFSASLSTFPTGLGSQHPIPFDKVLTNAGNAFDTTTHTFICPVNGIYYFHVSLMSTYHQHIETELVKDNVVLARNYAAGAQTSAAGHGYDQGGNAVVVPCGQGEHVWVRNRGASGTEITGDEFSTFLGFLLFST